MVGRIGCPPADVGDLVFGEGERRGIGAAPQHQRVVVVRHFEVVGVGVEALELDCHLHRLAAAADRHRPFDSEGLAGAGEAFPQRPEVGGERPRGISRRIDGRRLIGADGGEEPGSGQTCGHREGQEAREAGRAGGDHENLLRASSGAGSLQTGFPAITITPSPISQSGASRTRRLYGRCVPRQRGPRAAAVWARGRGCSDAMIR